MSKEQLSEALDKVVHRCTDPDCPIDGLTPEEWRAVDDALNKPSRADKANAVMRLMQRVARRLEKT